ncbi:hypothetical protein KBTX_04532 [wastewater metagenome]|uniref:Uncharacterized protein n=2 Tax=unclassified sequences TaxID=12908 RepID=A0A5B8RJA0_9ZZZZ|nr:hypothetical protein KBTEX_04532 [uncultured organism]
MFRISVRAVFAHIQSCDFFLRCDAESDGFFQDKQDDKGYDGDINNGAGHACDLHKQLADAPSIE